MLWFKFVLKNFIEKTCGRILTGFSMKWPTRDQTFEKRCFFLGVAVLCWNYADLRLELEHQEIFGSAIGGLGIKNCRLASCGLPYMQNLLGIRRKRRAGRRGERAGRRARGREGEGASRQEGGGATGAGRKGARRGGWATSVPRGAREQ